jgi:hypothetical protein
VAFLRPSIRLDQINRKTSNGKAGKDSRWTHVVSDIRETKNAILMAYFASLGKAKGI